MAVRDAPGKRFPGAFFVLAIQLLLAPLPSAADCALPGRGSGATVARVIDGDTLDLTDGRRVRLIGVNAPELGHGRGPDQPLARAARDRLMELVGASGRQGVAAVPCTGAPSAAIAMAAGWPTSAAAAAVSSVN